MKKFITVFSVLVLMSVSLSAQNSDVKVITGDCTIIKEVKHIRIPQQGFFDYETTKENAVLQAKIEWHSVADGGRCTLSLVLPDGESGEVETWRNYDDLTLIRKKTSDGHYNYFLMSSMFAYFALIWIPANLDEEIPEGYLIDTTLREFD